jgi:hypothetical protein
MVLKRVIKVSDEVCERIEMLKDQWKFPSANQVLKKLLLNTEMSRSERYDPVEVFRNFLNMCTAKRSENIYILDCQGKKAVVSERTLADLVKRFDLKILIS